jgi:Ca-activated chloride channel family protein
VCLVLTRSKFSGITTRRWLDIAAALLLIATLAAAQSGVLIPLPSEKPNPDVLSLAAMNVDILIDNQHATVKVMQIFDNHTSGTLEGKYVFALPDRSSIADFAVWDSEVRIPGVMMEKQRANQIYESIKHRRTDPGIFQTTDADESSQGFSAKIFPITGHGTKRLEMEYTEELPVNGLSSESTFPQALIR